MKKEEIIESGKKQIEYWENCLKEYRADPTWIAPRYPEVVENIISGIKDFLRKIETTH